MSGYDYDGYGEYGGAPPPGSVPMVPMAPVPVVGGGGPGWRQFPHRSEVLPSIDFSTVEEAGAFAAGAGGQPRSDPMMIKSGGVISRPSGRWPAVARGQFVERTNPQGVLSGPPILDPENRILVPEHLNDLGELVPAHWQHKPYQAIRIRVTPMSGTPPNTAVSNSALVRVRGSSPFGGGVIQREFVLSNSQDACLMAGQYQNFELSVLAMTANTQVSWEWFNDTSGICAETELWSEFFNLAPGAFLSVPDGAIEAFFEGPVLALWQQWTITALNNAVRPFDRAGTSAAVPGGTTGVPVRGEQLQVAIPVGVPLNDVNIQFRLSPI